jgi:hypothetical protein
MQILNPTILVPQNPLSSLSASAYLITSFEAEEILKLRSVYKAKKKEVVQGKSYVGGGSLER